MPNKLRIVVRADLPAGAQACQGIHAAQEFIFQHPILATQWFRQSNTIALLTVPNEAALLELQARATDLGLGTALFREPDFGNAATALALEPSEAAKLVCSAFPLALAEAPT